MGDKKKYGCSVYDKPQIRFKENGCVMSWYYGLDHDPFPGSLTPIDTKFGKKIVFWEPKECEDGVWRPLGIEECTYTWNEDKKEYEGECEQCGKCCMMGGKNENTKCEFLMELSDEK